MIEFIQKKWVYHSLFWLLWFVVITYNNLGESYLTTAGWMFKLMLPLMAVTYSSYYLKEKFFDKRAYLTFFTLIIVLITLVILIVNTLPFFSIIASNSYSQDISNFVLFVLFANGLQYFKRGIVNQYQLQELRAQNAEIQLTALKAQLNPHFLFNTLNNIYAINQIDAQQGTEMIIELSEVMRYHLGFSKMKKVTLEDEIQLIKSYIALELLRLNDSFELKTDIEQPQPSLKIAPLLLLTFIENAFKHGTHPVQPSFVHLDLKTESKTLYFKLTNSIIANKKSVSTLIGLENTQKRLQLIYPKKHRLTIDKNAITYSVNLTIQL